jgi:hypothetical protein
MHGQLDQVRYKWGERCNERKHARRSNQIPYSEGLTVPVRQCKSRRLRKDISTYPYPQLGSVGDGQQDTLAGEIAFTCDSFNESSYKSPLGLGSPHTAVTTTAANLTEADMETLRVAGVTCGGCPEEVGGDVGQSHIAKQGMAVRVSGKVTINAHNGVHMIKHGQKVEVSARRIMKFYSRHDDPDTLEEPQMSTTGGVQKWLLRTEAAGRIKVEGDVLEFLGHQTARAFCEDDETRKEYSDILDADTRAVAHTQRQLVTLKDALLTVITEAQQAAQALQAAQENDVYVREEYKHDASHSGIAKLIDAAATYKESMGIPIGVALSDTMPGRPLTLLLCGGGQQGG